MDYGLLLKVCRMVIELKSGKKEIELGGGS